RVTSITGVCSETGSTVGTVNLANTQHTAAGTYSADSWSFTGTISYNNISAQTITDTISPKNLTISGAVANNKTYDGSTSATVNFSGATLVGVVPGDDVHIDSSSSTANFSDKNVGTGKAVTVSGVALSGTKAANYTLTQP